jgi:HAD superfamily hydrolase (TIGR01450 family)
MSSSLLTHIKLFLLDLDGTFYLGGQLLPGARRFLELLDASGRQFLFLTNNSSASATTYAKRLGALGVEVPASRVLTSGAATATLLHSEGVKCVYLVGTPDLHADFAAEGIATDGPAPELVVLGYDKTLTYAKLLRACFLIRAGLPWVATHPDINCPSAEGPMPDIGAFMAAIELSTGVPVSRVIGKPNPDFLRAAMLKAGVDAAATAMVGDRLYTDIAAAKAAKVLGVLVLSGETTRELLATSTQKPDLVVEDLGELGGLL